MSVDVSCPVFSNDVSLSPQTKQTRTNIQSMNELSADGIKTEPKQRQVVNFYVYQCEKENMTGSENLLVLDMFIHHITVATDNNNN